MKNNIQESTNYYYDIKQGTNHKTKLNSF